MKKISVPSLLEILYLTLGITSALLFIQYTIRISEPDDFGVFYYSAQTALHGGAIYDIYGPHNLPYWYFPWLAWFFIPLAFFPQEIAYAIYMTASIVCAFLSVYFLARKMAPQTSLAERIFMLSMSMILCWLLFRVGQMDFILLALAILMMHWLDTGKPYHASLFIPILLFKPHLFIIFFPYIVLKGGKKFFVGAALATLALVIISFTIIPDWPLRMLQLLAKSGHRMDNNWNFATLPNLLGSQENWSGTANLPFTFLLILAGFIVVWKIRGLQTFPLLSLTLAGSLFCAPRAYSYNFPLLIPAMIWLSADLPKPYFLIFWSAVGILPFYFRFSTGTYLIVLAVFLLGVIKAMRQQRETPRSHPTAMPS